ncbi:MAG: hypothetical protein ACOCXH_15470 [Cyclobacteriaceae bacterium]
MERNVLNNNQPSFTIKRENGKSEVTIKSLESADDASFLTYDQSLVLTITKDGEHVIKDYISHFPTHDEEAKVAEIDQSFSDFDELIIAVHAENELLSADINFNIIINYEYKK